MTLNRAHYALVLMIELAQVYKEKCVGISAIAEKHNLSVCALDAIVEKLHKAGYITHQQGLLSLQMSPDKISIWDIIESIEKGNLQVSELIDLFSDKQLLRTPTVMMVDKEMEVVLKIIQSRLKRQKLSAWSEKASKMIYI